VLHSSLDKSDPKAWVVHCRKAPFDVYIGRDNPMLGLRDVGFSNPFSHKANSSAEIRVATRQEAIERYEAWVLTQPELLERIRRELKGKILGCWCSPLACHGEVLARIANDLIVPKHVEQISLF
jgi:hypothetical protein